MNAGDEIVDPPTGTRGSRARPPARPRLSATTITPRCPPVAALMALSWLGLVVHNALSLPALTLLSPQNSLNALIAVGLIIGWQLLRRQRVAAVLLLGWGAVHLVGGAVVSVIPFGFLPFVPEQTLAHYLAHAVYGLAQLPLIGAMIGHLRAAPEPGGTHHAR